MGSVRWTVIAAVFFTYLNNGLSDLTTIGPLIYGLAVIVVLLVAPGGIASLTERAWDWLKSAGARRGGTP
jgi:ABC-type branched-subunit amino acid transport system permease subunit